MENERKWMLKLFDNYSDIMPNNLHMDLPRKPTIFEKSTTASIRYREKGNKVYRQAKHGARVHEQIWKFYSFSIAIAPAGSDVLALGYANRSALLAHLKKYEDCLKDIDRALLVTKSCELKVKLFCRKTECLVALQEGKQRSAFEQAKYWFSKLKESKDVQRLTKLISKAEKVLEVNEKDYGYRRKKNFSIECSNDAFDIDYTEKYGRHLNATRDIDPGDFICMDQFYVVSVNGKKNYAFCSHCLAISWATIPCDYCAYAMYCSEYCKQKAWKQYHDIECSIKIIAYTYEQCIIQMSIRALIMGYKEAGNVNNLKKMLEDVLNCPDEKTRGFSKNGKLANNSFRSLFSLSYLKEFDLNRLHYGIIGLILLGTNKSNDGKIFTFNNSKILSHQKYSLFFGTLLLRLISILSANSFSVLDDSYFSNKPEKIFGIMSSYSRGIGCSPLPSLFNHSCDNNATRFYTNDGKVVYYANQPIKNGAQIFTSYYCNFIKDPKEARQLFLKGMYEIDCDCQACKKNWPSYDAMMTKLRPPCSNEILLLMIKCEEIIKKMSMKDHRHSRKTIKLFVEDSKTLYKIDCKPSFSIQSFMITLINMIGQRYGTVLRIPNQCSF